MYGKKEAFLKIWRGYYRIGYWKKMLVRLEDNVIYFTSPNSPSSDFQIYIKMLKVKKIGKLQFSIHNGLNVIFFKTPSQEVQEEWVHSLYPQ